VQAGFWRIDPHYHPYHIAAAVESTLHRFCSAVMERCPRCQLCPALTVVVTVDRRRVQHGQNRVINMVEISNLYRNLTAPRYTSRTDGSWRGFVRANTVTIGTAWVSCEGFGEREREEKRGGGRAAGLWPHTSRAVRPVSRATPFGCIQPGPSLLQGNRVAEMPLVRILNPCFYTLLSGCRLPWPPCSCLRLGTRPSTRLPRAWFLSYLK